MRAGCRPTPRVSLTKDARGIIMLVSPCMRRTVGYDFQNACSSRVPKTRRPACPYAAVISFVLRMQGSRCRPAARPCHRERLAAAWRASSAATSLRSRTRHACCSRLSELSPCKSWSVAAVAALYQNNLYCGLLRQCGCMHRTLRSRRPASLSPWLHRATLLKGGLLMCLSLLRLHRKGQRQRAGGSMCAISQFLCACAACGTCCQAARSHACNQLR